MARFDGGDSWDAATQLIAGGRPLTPGSPLNAPIVPATSFLAGTDVGYSRAGNPTWAPFEEILGQLEGGCAVAFGSGMAAISAALTVLCEHASEIEGEAWTEDSATSIPVVASPEVCYSGTRQLLARLVRHGRIRQLNYCGDDPTSVAGAASEADVLIIESPANPTMTITDISAAVAAARAAGTLTLCDNTYSTPLVTRPLELGVDIVIHSASKYLAGHSDALLGIAIAGHPQFASALLDARMDFGGVPGVLESYLATRGLRTLALRMGTAQANAGDLARRLAYDKRVAWVRYPGLHDDPGHQVAAQQMQGFGAVIAFGPAGGLAEAERLPASTRLWLHATSLGGVESTLERRRRHEMESPLTPPDLIRLSVGCEAVEDLWSDLDQALGG